MEVPPTNKQRCTRGIVEAGHADVGKVGKGFWLELGSGLVSMEDGLVLNLQHDAEQLESAGNALYQIEGALMVIERALEAQEDDGMEEEWARAMNIRKSAGRMEKVEGNHQSTYLHVLLEGYMHLMSEFKLHNKRTTGLQRKNSTSSSLSNCSTFHSLDFGVTSPYAETEGNKAHCGLNKAAIEDPTRQMLSACTATLKAILHLIPQDCIRLKVTRLGIVDDTYVLEFDPLSPPQDSQGSIALPWHGNRTVRSWQQLYTFAEKIKLEFPHAIFTSIPKPRLLVERLYSDHGVLDWQSFLNSVIAHRHTLWFPLTMITLPITSSSARKALKRWV